MSEEKLLKEIEDLKKQIDELTERVDTLEGIVSDVPDDVIYPWCLSVILKKNEVINPC